MSFSFGSQGAKRDAFHEIARVARIARSGQGPNALLAITTAEKVLQESLKIGAHDTDVRTHVHGSFADDGSGELTIAFQQFPAGHFATITGAELEPAKPGPGADQFVEPEPAVVGSIPASEPPAVPGTEPAEPAPSLPVTEPEQPPANTSPEPGQAEPSDVAPPPTTEPVEG